MKRLISALLVVVFAILALAIPAEAQSRAQRYPGDYGRYDSRYDRYDRGSVQCRYDRYGRPYACRRYDDRRRTGSVGTFIAGAIVGGVATAVITSRRNDRQEVQQGPMSMAQPQQAVQQVPYEAPVEMVAPRPQQPTTPIAGPAANGGEGQFELSNSTRVYVEAYDGETYIGRLSPVGMPGSTLKVGPPKDRYQGFALIPQLDGRLANDELGREVSPSGWSFIEPSVARQGGK